MSINSTVENLEADSSYDTLQAQMGLPNGKGNPDVIEDTMQLHPKVTVKVDKENRKVTLKVVGSDRQELTNIIENSRIIFRSLGYTDL